VAEEATEEDDSLLFSAPVSKLSVSELSLPVFTFFFFFFLGFVGSASLAAAFFFFFFFFSGLISSTGALTSGFLAGPPFF
jgi:hypothetical protein